MTMRGFTMPETVRDERIIENSDKLLEKGMARLASL
jgi:hypothetical protein